MWILLMGGAVIAAVLVVALCLGRAAAMADRKAEMPKVRGWDQRPKDTVGEDDWWMREYPARDDELPGLWERADYEGGKHG